MRKACRETDTHGTRAWNQSSAEVRANMNLISQENISNMNGPTLQAYREAVIDTEFLYSQSIAFQQLLLLKC